MGYYWILIESDVSIPETDEVLQKLKDINTTHHLLKRGHDSNGNKWFSWMPEDYDKIVKSVEEVFILLGFECSLSEEEYDNKKIKKIHLESFDNKLGQEILFLAIISEFIENGCYMKFKGEDGSIY